MGKGGYYLNNHFTSFLSLSVLPCSGMKIQSLSFLVLLYKSRHILINHVSYSQTLKGGILGLQNKMIMMKISKGLS